jgi:hypothetical protein
MVSGVQLTGESLVASSAVQKKVEKLEQPRPIMGTVDGRLDFFKDDPKGL